MNRVVGDKAESYVADYLEERGYQIITRNFRADGGELDIIVCKSNLYTAIEVKYQRLIKGEIWFPISNNKLKKVTRTFLYWAHINDVPTSLLFSIFGCIVSGDFGIANSKSTLEWIDLSTPF